MLYPFPLPGVSILREFKFNLAKNSHLWKIDNYHKPVWLNSSSEALFNICRRTDGGNVSIMLPAYFCGQSLRYLRHAKVSLLFYEVCEDLSPDYYSIEKTLQKVKPDFFLHVHYFGCIDNQTATRELCDRYGMTMIEDCAHVIHPIMHKNWVGDYVIFSPHKFFPISRASAVFSKDGIALSDLNLRKRTPYSWFLKKLLVRYAPLNKINMPDRWRVKWSSCSKRPTCFSPGSLELGIVSESRKAIQDISRERLNNKKRLLQAIERIEDWRALTSCHSKGFYVLGMQCKNKEMAVQIWERLCLLNCPAMMWPDLPIEIKDPLVFQRFQNDIDRVQNTIFFFLHEQLDINQYIVLIKEAVRARQA